MLEQCNAKVMQYKMIHFNARLIRSKLQIPCRNQRKLCLNKNREWFKTNKPKNMMHLYIYAVVAPFRYLCIWEQFWSNLQGVLVHRDFVYRDFAHRGFSEGFKTLLFVPYPCSSRFKVKLNRWIQKFTFQSTRFFWTWTLVID